jgi:hypothetical protein
MAEHCSHQCFDMLLVGGCTTWCHLVPPDTSVESSQVAELTVTSHVKKSASCISQLF